MAGMVVLGLGLASGAQGALLDVPVVDEDFEQDADGWDLRGSGLSRDCSTGAASTCSFRLEPRNVASYSQAIYEVVAPRALTEMTLSFDFKGNRLVGDTDSAVVLGMRAAPAGVPVSHPFLQQTCSLYVAPTWGVGLNNEVRIGSCLGNAVVGRWWSTDTWFHVDVTIDPITATASAEMFDSQGNRIGASSDVPLLRTTLVVDQVQLQAVPWNSYQGSVYHYDNIRLTASV